MPAVPVVLAALLALAASAQEQPVIVRAGGLEMTVAEVELGRGEEDVKDLESFLLVGMSRRGVCLDKLGPAFFERLLRVLAKAQAQDPIRFRYFTLMAPRFDDQKVTEVFVVLRDAPDGFPAYVAEQVRFFTPAAPVAEAKDGQAAPAQPGDPSRAAAQAPALREEQISEVAIREYMRWQAHCGLFCPGKGLTGDPDGNSVDFEGNGQSWDLAGLMQGSAWDAGKRKQGSAPSVSASGDLKAVGPASRPDSR